mgnify:FL=1
MSRINDIKKPGNDCVVGFFEIFLHFITDLSELKNFNRYGKISNWFNRLKTVDYE